MAKSKMPEKSRQRSLFREAMIRFLHNPTGMAGFIIISVMVILSLSAGIISGGMLQRIVIAIALACSLELLLADEPTSALDVTTQAQIVRQMMELRDEYGTSIIVVTHNLGVAAYMSDWIVVMKDGRISDSGDRDAILHENQNAYTRKLLDAVPSLGGKRYV